jgi:alkyl sulfatase BDS1-like metallo-beta-lactamase superfamily hydrolase
MESATARNAFLQGAAELRDGVPAVRSQQAGGDLLRSLPLSPLLESLAVRLDAGKAEGQRIAVHLHLTDSGQQAWLLLENGALHHRLQSMEGTIDATLSLDRAAFDDVLRQRTTLRLAVQGGRIQAEGSVEKVDALLAMLDHFDRRFPVVVPRPD